MKLMSEPNEKEIERVIELMRADKSVDAPADAIRWSKNIFRSRVVEPKVSFPQRILASLQANLAPNQAVFGERSAANSQARQMLFQAGENILDIRIAQTENGFNLHGQILGEDFANRRVLLGDFEATTNENSEFKLADIPGGEYRLLLQNGEKEIVVENLKLE